MERRSMSPRLVPVGLLLFSAIPILLAALRSVQVPTGSLPPDAIKFAATPVGLFLHAGTGVLFSVIGPIQFGRVLARRFGALHRLLGRVFVISGIVLAASGLRLIWAFPGTSTWLLDLTRVAASVGLGLSLWWAIKAARRKDITVHSAWMIRAYAFGIGSSTIAFIMFPIFILTGEAPTGIISDLLFLASWIINLSVAEAIITRSGNRAGRAASSLTIG